jgi:AcrR family transcriptional regulator
LTNTTKNFITEKAFKLFSKNGYDGTGMEEIAVEVGIRKASLYSHFKGKEEILREVFNKVLDEYSGYMNGLIRYDSKKDIKQNLAVIFLNYVSYFMDQEKMDFWMKLYIAPPEFIKEEIFNRSKKIDGDFLMKLNEFFKQALKNKHTGYKNTLDTAISFFYLMTGIGMTASFYKMGNLKRTISGCIDVFWNGIKNRTL